MFDLHVKAIENINETAKKLIELIEELNLPKQQNNVNNDFYAAATLTDKDILSAKYSLSNMSGEVSKYFFVEDKAMGFINESYEEFNYAALKIYKNKCISQKVGFEYLKEKLFDWIEGNVVGSITNEFFTFFTLQAEKDIKDYEIIIPIPFTTTNKEFVLGRIKYTNITERVIEDWFTNANIHSGNESSPDNKINAFKIRIKKDIQGYIAGVYTCNAEQTRAKELAYAELSNSLSCLRLLSPANFNYNFICMAQEYGECLIKKSTYISVDCKTSAFNYNSAILQNNFMWNINEDVIDIISKGVFQKAHELLLIDSHNDFQAKLLNAIIIYSKNTISTEIYDKILYILVALESMLLKNDSEPIQQNIGMRLAYLIANTLDSRKDVIKTVKDIYAIRSKYIHHGIVDFKDEKLMLKFMNYAMSGFAIMIDSIKTFNSKDEFVAYLDDLTLS